MAKWTQPSSPPPPLFVGQAERNFVKQINDELIERVVGQQVLYLPIDMETTNYHKLYGEALKKTFSDEDSLQFGIYTFEFSEEDIMRSELVKFIIKKLKTLEDK